MASTSRSSSTSDDVYFGDFFKEWLVTLQSDLEQLNFLSSQVHLEVELENIVGRVVSHYQHYYETKSRATRENVLLLLSSPWLSTYERSLLWISGFRPGVSFRLVETLLGGELSSDQVQKIKRLKAETSAQEKALSNEMARIQESVAGPSWMEICNRMDTQVVCNGDVDQVIGKIKGELTDLAINADNLRATTGRKLINILSPVHATKVLAATARLQLRVNAWGVMKDADRMARMASSSV
ncbi:hypothetical protein AQUCO_01200212v1 [Aquilegia coerulea]|uniref:DOG1 domain-containing protein n=1 Tax=Aquilegia coerulea TaxID=218851 RepID=A0A2G5E4Z4_AQUCA|nr:hypothetical protein AQUCO_01200212v1 [Aquilegia coerulea]